MSLTFGNSAGCLKMAVPSLWTYPLALHGTDQCHPQESNHAKAHVVEASVLEPVMETIRKMFNSRLRWLSNGRPSLKCRERLQWVRRLYQGLSPYRCQVVPGQVNQPFPSSTVGSQGTQERLLEAPGWSCLECRVTSDANSAGPASNCTSSSITDRSIWGPGFLLERCVSSSMLGQQKEGSGVDD